MYNDFQIFVKPAGAECNLRCSYCYYLEKKNLHGDAFLMDEDVLERYIISHFEACPDNNVNFSWHGGEPLLSGIEFFRKVVALQKRYAPAGVTASNGIQTNGTLINDEWCSFFADENFYVGISIDGPAQFHNIFRINSSGADTFDRVMHGLSLLGEYGIVHEALCVINSVNVRHPLKIYDFFRQSGVQFISFLPLVGKQSDMPGGVSSATVPSKEFGVFLSTIFDHWVENGIGEIKIQVFEEALRPAFNQDHTLCIFKKTCGGVPVLEKNGDFYSCDHYVNKEHLIGNIKTESIADMLNSRRQIEFGRTKLDTLPAYCINCDVRDMCNGECPKNRFIRTPEGEPGLNYLCEGYKHFFNHCKPFIEAISQALGSC